MTDEYERGPIILTVVYTVVAIVVFVLFKMGVIR